MIQPLTTESVWELFSDKLRAYFGPRASSGVEVEDLLQETFLRIHYALGGLEDRDRLVPWVYRIAHNVLVDSRRGQAWDVGDLSAESLASEEGEGDLNEVVSGWLPVMVSLLPPTYRDAVELFEIEGLPQKEIAERLGLSLSGVKSRVQRGREKLKAQLFACCTFERDRRGNVIGYEQRVKSAEGASLECKGDCG